jgi:hypothetical protein
VACSPLEFTMRLRFSLLLSVATFTTTLSYAADAARPEVDITATFAAGTTAIRVVADQPELQKLATQAFSAHGAFRIESGGSHKTRPARPCATLSCAPPTPR